MANFKHKVFLLIAKWIPVAVAAGILINNTLAMLDVKDVILDLFDITVGSSLAFVIMISPTVTGYASYNPCACHTTTSTPSAN